MLAYVGPEAIAPVASVLAGIAGVILIGWRWIASRCKRVYRFVFRIKVDETEEFEEEQDVPSETAERS